MMPAERESTGTLLDRLPVVRGRLRPCVALNDLTWFRVGGAAEVMFRPADSEDLAHFLRNCPADVPVIVLGVGSNLLVRDGGVPGVVIRLGGPFAQMEVQDDVIVAGAGALDANVALTAADRGIAGLEFLSGIPGTVGGGLRMNAGAYGRELKDVVLQAEAVDRNGIVHQLGPDDLGFSYRAAAVPTDWIFTAARLQGSSGQKAEIAARITDIRTMRESTQPVRARTGGSTFKNPVRDGAQLKAWKLIRDAGCAGLQRGGAAVSEQHSNFLINTGGATAADLEELGLEVVDRVLASSGVTLEWEIRRIGAPAGEGPRDCMGAK